MLISAALSLELWNLGAAGQLPTSLHSTLGFERIVLAIHAVEGFVAAAFATSRQEQPLRYGVYTFFTGLIGLMELFDQQESSQ